MALRNTILTGIKPTGFPHIGNYLGAIKPALKRAKEFNNSYFFVADYHALNSIQDSNKLNDLTISVAATWLAAGLDTKTSHFYLQSDIPEVFELATILGTFTPKGWMNKSHAYKAAVEDNRKDGLDLDAGINMGLYTYPILMAADILLFGGEVIPVGKDQVQHVEIARDIAERFNRHYQKEVFILPTYVLEEEVSELPGLDGRKMSKSYGNVIPLFATKEDWTSAVKKIKTDSTDVSGYKSVKDSILFTIYSSLSNNEDSVKLKNQLENGTIGWAKAKEELISLLEENFSDMSNVYFELVSNPQKIRDIFNTEAEKIHPIAQETMRKVRSMIGKF